MASHKKSYLADSLIVRLGGQRSSLKSVKRDAYCSGVSLGGAVAFSEGAVGDIEPGIDPEPTEKAVWGKYTLHRGRKVYELKNHPSALLRTSLGNVLAVVSDVKIGQSSSSQVAYYVADVVEMTDYEPFGMQLANRHFVSGDRYRFGFQGQEGDDEWNGEGSMLAFKYRIHDARLGRFLSVDPLSDSYPWNSSYAFAENRVIQGVELEGAEFQNKNSSVVGFRLKTDYSGSSIEIYALIPKLNGATRILMRRSLWQNAGSPTKSGIWPDMDKFMAETEYPLGTTNAEFTFRTWTSVVGKGQVVFKQSYIPMSPSGNDKFASNPATPMSPNNPSAKKGVAAFGSFSALFNSAVEELVTKPQLAEDYGKLTTQISEVEKSITMVEAAYKLNYLPASLQSVDRRTMLAQYVFNGEMPMDEAPHIQRQIAKMGAYIYRNRDCGTTGQLPTEPNPFADQIKREKEEANRPQNNGRPRNYEYRQN